MKKTPVPFKARLSAAKLLACTLSAIFLMSNASRAQSQMPENLVLAEVLPTQITETLDGASIGMWQFTGSTGNFIDLDNQNGGLYGPGLIVFLDPMNPGSISAFGNGTFNDEESPSVVYGHGYDVYPTTQAGLSDSYSYAQSAADVIVNGLPVPVNISLIAVPEASTLSIFAAGLAFLGIISSRPAGRRCKIVKLLCAFVPAISHCQSEGK